MMYYKYSATDEIKIENESISEDKNSEDIKNQNTFREKDIVKNNTYKEEKEDEEHKSTINVEEIKEEANDSNLVFEFKKEIYNIEKIALIPMRECIPNAKTFLENASNLTQIRKEVSDAQQKCEEVVETYEVLEIPDLERKEYKEELYEAKMDVQKAYILRGKAMESGVSFINTKNPRYLGEVKEYMELSDKYIKNFVDKVKLVEDKLEK